MVLLAKNQEYFSQKCEKIYVSLGDAVDHSCWMSSATIRMRQCCASIQISQSVVAYAISTLVPDDK